MPGHGPGEKVVPKPDRNKGLAPVRAPRMLTSKPQMLPEVGGFTVSCLDLRASPSFCDWRPCSFTDHDFSSVRWG
jgi:hypothetical protein